MMNEKSEIENEKMINDEKEIIVSGNEVGNRIDKFLSENLDLTRTRIQQLIKD